jgi:hypothetical protein
MPHTVQRPRRRSAALTHTPLTLLADPAIKPPTSKDTNYLRNTTHARLTLETHARVERKTKQWGNPKKAMTEVLDGSKGHMRCTSAVTHTLFTPSLSVSQKSPASNIATQSNSSPG